jgi:hypothetical protein
MNPDEVMRRRLAQRQRWRERPSPEARGYGSAHRALRARLAVEVEAGRALCARCGEPILPTQAFDLGHVDGDRSRWSGPEHRHSRDCPEGGNRATAGRRDRDAGWVRRFGEEPGRRWSRRW